MQDNMVVLMDPNAVDGPGRRERAYTFDACFDQLASNVEVYNVTVKPLVQYLLQGYNTTCFAYGQTGAGKTYTMMGDMVERGITRRRNKGMHRTTLENRWTASLCHLSVGGGLYMAEKKRGCARRAEAASLRRWY